MRQKGFLNLGNILQHLKYFVTEIALFLSEKRRYSKVTPINSVAYWF